MATAWRRFASVFEYPECDEEDLRATIAALAALHPVTIFHEPSNIRGKNVKRIEAERRQLG